MFRIFEYLLSLLASIGIATTAVATSTQAPTTPVEPLETNVHVRLVDADEKPVPNCDVREAGDTTEAHYGTDNNGERKMLLPVGKSVISVSCPQREDKFKKDLEVLVMQHKVTQVKVVVK